MLKKIHDADSSSYSPRNRRVAKHRLENAQRVFGFAQIAVFYCVLVVVQTLLFVYFKDLSYKIVAYSMLPGLLLGISIRFFEWFASLLKGLTTYFMGKLLAGFILFFVYLIVYILLFSFVVASPLGTIIEQTSGSVNLSRDYGLYSINSMIVLSVLSWINWLRSIAWNVPKRVNNSTRS